MYLLSLNEIGISGFTNEDLIGDELASTRYTVHEDTPMTPAELACPLDAGYASEIKGAFM